MKRIILLLAIVITRCGADRAGAGRRTEDEPARGRFSQPESRIGNRAGSQVDAGRLGAVQRVDALAPAPAGNTGPCSPRLATGSVTASPGILSACMPTAGSTTSAGSTGK